LEIKYTEMDLMPKMTRAAAQHVMMWRIYNARDAYEVFGWTAATVFTFAEIRARTAEFHEAMDYDQSPVWWRQSEAVRAAFRAIRLGAFECWTWAMQIVADRELVMHDLSDEETDMEA
jgi:hypothetical protein